MSGTELSDESIMEALLQLWPQGQMDLSEVMAAFGRALDNPKAGSRGPRKSLEGVEAPNDLQHPGATTMEAHSDQAQPISAVGRCEKFLLSLHACIA